MSYIDDSIISKAYPDLSGSQRVKMFEHLREQKTIDEHGRVLSAVRLARAAPAIPAHLGDSDVAKIARAAVAEDKIMNRVGLPLAPVPDIRAAKAEIAALPPLSPYADDRTKCEHAAQVGAILLKHNIKI